MAVRQPWGPAALGPGLSSSPELCFAPLCTGLLQQDVFSVSALKAMQPSVCSGKRRCSPGTRGKRAYVDRSLCPGLWLAPEQIGRSTKPCHLCRMCMKREVRFLHGWLDYSVIMAKFDWLDDWPKQLWGSWVFSRVKIKPCQRSTAVDPECTFM